MRARTCDGRFMATAPSILDPFHRLQLQQAFDRCAQATEIGPRSDPTRKVITPEERDWFFAVVRERPEWARRQLCEQGFDARPPASASPT